MKESHKIIRDSIHGNIKFDGVFLDLLDASEMQRLYNVKQLGLAHLVFPGAHHTRLEHSLGAYHIARNITEMIPLDEGEQELVMCAALLHDIGHGPFSHTLESILRESLNVDHVDLTEKLIKGDYSVFHDDESSIISQKESVFSILESHGIDQQLVSDMIRGDVSERPYLGQLLNSVIDVDQLDYLLRDAYYTGVAYGMIDLQRFMQTVLINGTTLAIDRKGIGVVESVLMARLLMYNSVYFHKTVRIAELMLSKAIELTEYHHPFDFFKMTDAELVNWLKQQGVYQHDIVTRLKYRQLFKQAFKLSLNEVNEDQRACIRALDDVAIRREKECMFEDCLDIPKGYIIIDVPSKDIYQAEPRIIETDLPIFDDGQIHMLHEYTPIADAIRLRAISEWEIMIVTDKKYRSCVAKKAASLLFDN